MTGDGMQILAWAVVGLVAGWLAGILLRGSPTTLLGNILVGIVGALTGGIFARALLDIPVATLSLSTILIALLGAILLIGLLRLLRRSETA
jgi:uncharacterized membrane protein YeaQ/YmgE (transglycosylase-associated protein family)